MGAYADAEAAIKSRMDTEWTALHPTIPVYFENEGVNADRLDSSTTTSWLDVYIRPGRETHSEFGGGAGANRWRKSGEVLIRVFTKVNTDKAVINGLIDDAAGIFRGWLSGDLKFFAVGDAAGGQTQEHGSWFERAVIASFTFDLSG
jgi:hypothetical protein